MLKSKFPSPLSTVDISFFESSYIFSCQDTL
ncbi:MULTISPECIES: hypothetical protein [Staphylococcus]|uniref:Uncharacterized protein n=1 Tax=Staphylococcus aureus TaxID=1280 RepID=A0AAE2ZYZ6_STAAU|nr:MULTISPECIES: hypothetical protein [Staphylococcus]HDH6200650.1 hypothetical protein [Staphylococcus aureus LTCF-15-62]HDH6209564.1 hypothetical protein [Staphylococcus aureus LTCF-14-59]HDH6281051.1 hypothetical protein [Staphylococcus aureus LTCF-3-23]HDH6492871.1 hypothetical protein [Staphylococcus aureus MRSA-Lux-7]HDK8312196.1 hypothetical protein [Staphylococcus aureus subsp. aureus ST22]